jgi:hypothetical protein
VAPSLRVASRVAALTLLGAAVLVGCADCNKGGESAGGDGARAADASPADAAGSAPHDGAALNATPLPAASVAAMVNPDKLPPYTGPTGSVEGTVTVTGDPARATPNDFSRCPDAEKTWGHAFREGPSLDDSATGPRPLADAVVVVTGYSGFYMPEKTDAKEVRIERCAPTTRTVTMTFGQRLEVKNLSNDFWTPMLEPGASIVLTMATPNGDPAKFYPKKPGRYLLTDRDRRYASVDVYAFLHPLHASTALTGYYRIDGVPVGKLKVSTMHPHIEGKAEREITVSPGVVHKVDLVLTNVNRDAEAPPVRDAAAPPPLR